MKPSKTNGWVIQQIIKEVKMSETEMSMDEVLSSIRQILTDEVGKNQTTEVVEEGVDEVFVLTSEMRCDTPTSQDLKDRMQRVLDKMAHQELGNKKQTVIQELQPLLKDWMVQMRPDLDETHIQLEINKILPNL